MVEPSWTGLGRLGWTGLGQLGWPNPVQPSPGQPSRLHLIGSSGVDRGWLHLIGSSGVDWIQPSWLHLIGSSGVDRVQRGHVDPVRPSCQNRVQTRPGNLVRLDELDSFRSSWAGCVRSTPLDAVGAGRVGVTVSDAVQPTWSDLARRTQSNAFCTPGSDPFRWDGSDRVVRT